ncbi:MAG TPA: CBS domain-containing protein [Polyangiaceae bacterium]|nr:CBS domain-containing protein [Polyangiaceae bacterium]
MHVPVSGLMAPDPLSVGPELSAALARLMMLEDTIGALPVVDAVGRPIGMLSKTDIVREAPPRSVSREEPDGPQDLDEFDDLDSEDGGLRAIDSYIEGINEPRVRDLMTTLVVSVSAETTILEAARAMVERGVHHLLVLGRHGELVGILSAFDFVRAVARLAEPPTARRSASAGQAPKLVTRSARAPSGAGGASSNSRSPR